EISMKDVFRSGDSSKKFKIAEGQWYRYAPSYVSPAYHLLEGFPFIQEPPSGDLQERVLIRHHDYDQRSEERRVGKECRCRWSLDHSKKRTDHSSTMHASEFTIHAHEISYSLI